MRKQTDIERQYAALGILPIGGGEQTTTTTETPPTPTPETPPAKTEDTAESITFSDEQQRVINKLMAKAKREGEEKAEQARLDAEADAKRKAEQDQQLARGEFDQVKAAIETERDEVKAEAERIRSENERYAALATKRLESLKADLDLPAEVMKTYPADAPILDQLDWLEDRAAIWEAARQANGGPKGAVVTATPKAAGSTQPDIDRITADMRSRISI
jgi:hypothetical protein